jgi:hypothetical protein
MGASPPALVADLVERFSRDRKACPERSRRVFLSPDYKEEQLRAEFLDCLRLTIRHPDLASAGTVGQRVVRASPGPFFTALGWDMDDTSLPRFVPEIGEVSVLPLPKSRSRSPMGTR